MRNAECRMRNRDYWFLVTGCSLSDSDSFPHDLFYIPYNQQQETSNN